MTTWTWRRFSLLNVLFAMAALIAACSAPQDDHDREHDDHGHPHENDEGGAHEHDGGEADAHDDHHADHETEKTAVITLWGDRFEVFMEYEYPVAGEPVRFITHLTDLATLEPRREGPAQFVFVHESGEKIEHVEDHVARDGIYLPEIAFEPAGTWQMAIEVPHKGKRFVIDMPPVEVYPSIHEIAHAPAPEEHEGISFLKEQQWKIGTGTEPVERRTVTDRLVLPGVVTAPPGNAAAVTPPVPGRLLPPPDGRMPYVGDRVEAGAPLARIQPPLAGSDVLAVISNQNQIRTMEADLRVKASEAEAAAARAKLDLDHARHILERIQQLYEREAKSERELEEARFAVREAENRLQTQRELAVTYGEALERLNSRDATLSEEDGLPSVELRAPITGTIVAMAATVGEHVQPNQTLFKLVDTSRVFIEAKVPEADVARLTSSKNALYQLPGADEQFYAIADQGGRLVFIGATVDPRTRTVPLVYEAPNPKGDLRLGMAVTVHAETGHAEDALVIPESAIVDEDGQPVAFVQVSGETFQKRTLRLGVRDGEFVQVLSGVEEGERVVTKGAYAVRLASVSTAIPAHGHAH